MRIGKNKTFHKINLSRFLIFGIYIITRDSREHSHIGYNVKSSNRTWEKAMKIDKDKLDAITKLSDEELWEQIKSVARQHGVKMPDKQPSGSDLGKVRDALAQADKLSLMTAMRMVNNLKKGG